MPLHLSGHLPNVALLALSAAVALVADRLATTPVRALAADAASVGNVAPYMTPVAPDSITRRYVQGVAIDPFDRDGGITDVPTVAPATPSTTLSRTPAAGRRLTAILIADERRIAVIDDATVKVGDLLRDGSRVAAIQADRVFVSDRAGRMRTLTLTAGGQ